MLRFAQYEPRKCGCHPERSEESQPSETGSRTTVGNSILCHFRTGLRDLALAAVVFVAGPVPSHVHAASWSVLAAPQATAPVGAMAHYFGWSPSIGVGAALDRGSAQVRLVGRYTALRSRVSALPETTKYMDNPETPQYDRMWIPTKWSTGLGGTVHHGSLVAELVIPQAFGLRWLRLVGGAGVATRKLNEGRQFEETMVDEHLMEVRTRVRKGIGESTVDLVGRLGIEVRVWETRRWSAWGGVSYQASFTEINAPGVPLDMRVDEVVQTGVFLCYHFGTHH